jgi:class 3 adenylate cyclase
MVRVAALWGMGVTGAAFVTLLLPRPDVPGLRATGATAVAGVAFVVTAVLTRSRSGLPPVAERWFIAGMFAAMMAMVALLGPSLEVSTTAAAASNALGFLFVRRRHAFIGLAVSLIGFSAVVLLVDGYAAPHLHIIIFSVITFASGTVSVWIVTLVEDLEAQERAARAEVVRAQVELAELNRQLEERLDAQGAELGSLRQLRQFLSPQVAEAVLQKGIEALAPHRARIAVLFCDLRGFTTFSSTAEPEEVMEVLDRYYVTVGRALQACHATVGTFAGDGIMAYFGDPVPHEDPAGTAIEMAVALRGPMREVVTSWRRRGFDLGCGMGIAYGYATIGPVGFDERTDYTALGPTVNLASRLCSMAEDNEILIDGRAHEAVEDRVRTEERVVQVRGFRAPVTAHNVLEWCAGADEAVTA